MFSVLYLSGFVRIDQGTANISSVFSGQLGTAALTITDATLNSIAITPGTASISTGASQQFNAREHSVMDHSSASAADPPGVPPM